MECMNECGTELTGRQKRFCSDKCRMARSRTKSNAQQAAQRTKSNKPEQIHPLKVEQTKLEHQSRTKPTNYGLDDCECQHCKTNRFNGNKHTINHGAYKRSHELGEHEINRVSLPGDVDYTGVAKEG